MKQSDLSNGQAFVKRFFDFLVSLVGLILAWWLVLLAWVAASIDTRSNGCFIQQRVQGKRMKTLVTAGHTGRFEISNVHHRHHVI